MEELGALVRLAGGRTRIPIVFHLDHGKNVDLIRSAIKSGLYTSVMFDGSSLPYAENVRATKALVALARKAGVSVEAELGAIAGIEDFVTVADRDANLAAEFVRLTGCDALAIAVGTKHGAYKFAGESTLDYARIRKIAAAVSVPLVLHGASGVPESVKKVCVQYGCDIGDAKGVSDPSIRKAVALGINKVNIDTDLRIAFDAGVRRFLHDNPKVIDPREILKPASELMTKVIRQKMKLLGSSGKA
jgi:fructose-bisphosphate aldolase class II